MAIPCIRLRHALLRAEGSNTAGIGMPVERFRLQHGPRNAEVMGGLQPRARGLLAAWHCPGRMLFVPKPILLGALS